MFAIDTFYPGETLKNLYLQRIKQNEKQDTIQLCFKLLDSFVSLLNLNTIIASYENVFLIENEIYINKISMAGVNLIFFERPISLSEFK